MDTPSSLGKAIQGATLHTQVDLGIQAITPGSTVEESTITSIQHGAPRMEEVMVVMADMEVMEEVMVVMAVMEVMEDMEVTQVDISTTTQTTKF